MNFNYLLFLKLKYYIILKKYLLFYYYFIYLIMNQIKINQTQI